MKLFIGKSSDYSGFELLKRAYSNQFQKEITPEMVTYNPNGKPYFFDSKMPCFNISHSYDYIVCIFDKTNIGIDIQKIKRISEGVVKRYLHSESSQVRDLTIEWTKLESYGKMKGTGIPVNDDYRNGHFQILSNIEGYIITICTEKEMEQSIELIEL